MADGMTATVCTVAAVRRCEAPDDGPHSRVAYVGGRWWRWLPMGAWVLSAPTTREATPRAPSLPELAASVPTRDRPAALAAIGAT